MLVAIDCYSGHARVPAPSSSKLTATPRGVRNNGCEFCLRLSDFLIHQGTISQRRNRHKRILRSNHSKKRMDVRFETALSMSNPNRSFKVSISARSSVFRCCFSMLSSCSSFRRPSNVSFSFWSALFSMNMSLYASTPAWRLPYNVKNHHLHAHFDSGGGYLLVFQDLHFQFLASNP